MALTVVIIGAGQAGVDAAFALRQMGHGGPVMLFGAEAELPYSRPPLSKDYLLGSVAVERLRLRSHEAFARANIDWRSGARVVALHPEVSCVELADGTRVNYGACILATGAQPRTLPVEGAGLGNVSTLRELGDADRLGALLRPGLRLAVIGAGYLGLEIAASASVRGVAVTVVEAAPRLLARSASPATAALLAARHQRAGVRILTGASVARIEGEATADAVLLADGVRVEADAVLISAGAAPDIELARAAGLACATGVLADADARSSVPNIYAIGDCAEWDVGDGRGPLRLESVQVASQGARVAASAILGRPRPALRQPYFWSQQYELKLQIVGLVAPGSAVSDSVEGDAEAGFSVTRTVAGRIAAVETVNDPARFVAAQRLIGQPALQSA